MTTLSEDPTAARSKTPVVVGALVIAAISAAYATSVFGLFGAAPVPVSVKQHQYSSPTKTAATNSADMVEKSAKTVPGAATVDAQGAKVLFDRGAAFIDTRIDADWDAGRIPGAVQLELKANFTEGALRKLFRPDAEIVIYCNGETCLRSAEAAVKATGWGFTKVYYFRDGYPSWKTASYPVE